MCELLSYYFNNNKSSQLSLEKHYHLLKMLIPTWLEIKGNGSLIKKDNDDDRKLVKKFIDNENIIPLIQNYQLKSVVSNELVNNKDNWLKAANNIIEFLNINNYGEVNINMEGIKKNNKDKFINFIKVISQFLQQEGVYTGLSIPAKIDDNSSEWAGAYDYFQLGQLTERIIIMAYDYHWVNGPPGAIAPLFWVQDVIDYAIMKIDLEKIYLGIPLYGYDWLISDDTRPARGLSFAQIINLKNKYDVSIEWDQESQTPYLLYENNEGKHEVWFENKESVFYKLKLVKDYHLGGAVFWRLGLEDPAIWTVIEGNDLFY